MGIFGEKKKEEKRNGGPFVSFVLLDKPSFDIKKFIKDIKNDWNIDIPLTSADEEKETIIVELGGMMATVALMPAPIPDGEAVENAKTNFRWPEAVAIAEAHKAHLLVAVISHDQSLIDTAILMVKLTSSSLKQKNATSVNTLGSVFAPDFYINFAESYLKDKAFPIMNLVFFGIYSNDEGKTICGYTYGMYVFCKDEIEIINSAHSHQEVFEFLVDVASYVIEEDVILQDGETIGFTADQKLSITKSKSNAIDGDSLKIGF